MADDLESGSALDISVIALEGEPSGAALDATGEVLTLFDQDARALLRYVGSFGLPVHDTEDVVQDVFLSLFQHVRRGRSRRNLRGWVFRVAHNLALKRRQRLQQFSSSWDDALVEERADAGASPEEQASRRQRLRHLLAVVRALPERDRRCLCLRAEGLRYREIAEVLGISLGAVSKALTRTLGKLERAAER
jgi:RNA polymerase sigma-70 factor (ECF subfamily)